MLPYDGITRTGSKGVSHSGPIFKVQAKTPSEGSKVMQRQAKSKG